jgi:archaellum component FlaC
LRQEYRELSDNYALAVNHKNDTQDELNQARIKYQDASERIKTLEKTVVNVTNKYNEARESCMVWITENSELITMVAELERIKKVSISRPLKKAKKK